MKVDKTKIETFEDFKNSFSYGKRTDLNFKFLAGLDVSEAGDFFQSLLWKLGDILDDGHLKSLADHIRKWQILSYERMSHPEYSDGAFTKLVKPVSLSHLGLITSSGHFLTDDDPEPFGIKDMTQEHATKRITDYIRSAPVLSGIPFDTNSDNIRVRHPGYDTRAAELDQNVVFPIEILQEFASAGKIGQLADKAYSFVGACSQKYLLKKTLPEWIDLFKDEKIEAFMLVPV